MMNELTFSIHCFEMGAYGVPASFAAVRETISIRSKADVNWLTAE